MPHGEVLDRAREAGFPVWWTGRDGAVLIGLGDPLVAWGFTDLENTLRRPDPFAAIPTQG